MKPIARTLSRLLLFALAALMCLPAAGEQVPPVRKISLPGALTVYVGRTARLTPTVLPAGAQTAFAWRTAKPAVALVEDGLVTGVSPGKSRITVLSANGKKASCLVTVAQVPVESFELTWRESAGLDIEKGLLTGHQLQLRPAGLSPADAAPMFKYKSSKPAAAVDARGLVTAKSAGLATLTATAAHGGAAKALAVRVIANQRLVDEATFMEKVRQVVPQPIPGAGILAISKRVYVKRGSLMVDLYMYNADTRPLKGKGKMAVFLSESASTAQFEQYRYMGDYTVSLRRTSPQKFTLSTVRLGSLAQWGMDERTVVLLDAMAFGQEALGKSASPLLPRLVAVLARGRG